MPMFTEEIIEKINNLKLKSSKEIKEFFLSSDCSISSEVYRTLLSEVLKNSIFEEEKVKSYPDELIYRLKNYNYYSIDLLEQTKKSLDIHIDPVEFKELFFKFLFENSNKVHIDSSDIKELGSLNNAKDESEDEVLSNMKAIFKDMSGTLEGLPLSIAKQAISLTYTIPEIQVLFEKYNVALPKRINKTDLCDLLIARFKLAGEDAEKAKALSVLDLVMFAKKNGFRISTDLKKSDMVEYLIFKLSKYHEPYKNFSFNFDFLDNHIEEVVGQSEVVADDSSLPTTVEEVAEEAKEPSIDEELEAVEEEPKKAKRIPPKRVISDELPDLTEIKDNAIYKKTSVPSIREVLDKYYQKRKKAKRVKTFILILLVLALIAGAAAACYFFLFK